MIRRTNWPAHVEGADDRGHLRTIPILLSPVYWVANGSNLMIPCLSNGGSADATSSGTEVEKHPRRPDAGTCPLRVTAAAREFGSCSNTRLDPELPAVVDHAARRVDADGAVTESGEQNLS